MGPAHHPADTSDGGVGCELLTQRVLRLSPGRMEQRETGPDEELLFVVEGRGALRVGEAMYDLLPESAALCAPGTRYELEGGGADELVVVSVALHDPIVAADTRPATLVTHLSERDAQDATSEREFRVVFDEATGCLSATQFVGDIPPSRAPDHYHLYDEVLYVLDGQGAFHAHGDRTEVSRGSTIELPARTVHCLENVGDRTLRVLGVFRPSGSPAIAFYPDGTPAPVPEGPQHE